MKITMITINGKMNLATLSTILLSTEDSNFTLYTIPGCRRDEAALSPAIITGTTRPVKLA